MKNFTSLNTAENSIAYNYKKFSDGGKTYWELIHWTFFKEIKSLSGIEIQELIRKYRNRDFSIRKLQRIKKAIKQNDYNKINFGDLNEIISAIIICADEIKKVEEG